MNKQKVFRSRPCQIAVTFVDDNKNNLFTCGISGSKIRVPMEDGTYLERIPSSGFAWGIPDQTYMYCYDFTAEETALFKFGGDQSIFLQIDFGANHMKFEMKKFLTVLDDMF